MVIIRFCHYAMLHNSNQVMLDERNIVQNLFVMQHQIGMSGVVWHSWWKLNFLLSVKVTHCKDCILNELVTEYGQYILIVHYLQYELVAELFMERDPHRSGTGTKKAGGLPAVTRPGQGPQKPTGRGGVQIRAARDTPRVGQKSHRQTVGSQVGLSHFDTISCLSYCTVAEKLHYVSNIPLLRSPPKSHLSFQTSVFKHPRNKF